MPRPISKKFLAKVEALQEQIGDLINEARTIEQTVELQGMLEDMSVQADEKVCQLDSRD